MADFGGMVLTTKGLNLLAKAQTGAALVINRVAAGAGVWADGTNAEAVTALVAEHLTVPIQSIKVLGDGTVKITVVISNSGLTEGFIFRELGVFATDPDLGEILYAVAYAGDRYDYLPASATVVEKILDIYVVVGGTKNVTATISPGAVIALKDDIEEHTEADPAHPSAKIGFSNTLALLAGDPNRAQSAIEALANEVTDIESGLAAHEVADPAHPASRISFDNTNAALRGSPTRVQTAIEAIVNMLHPVTGNLVFYVRPDGDDSNDGSANDAAHAFKTIQHSIDYISRNFNLGSYKATVNIAAGSYSEKVMLGSYNTGSGSIYLVGAGVGSTIIAPPAGSKYVINSLAAAGVYTISGLTLDASALTSGANVVQVDKGVNLYLSSVAMICGSDGSNIAAYVAGLLSLSSCTITAISAYFAFFAHSGGTITIDGPLTINGTFVIVANCSYNAQIFRNISTLPVISGTATGTRYSASYNAVISVVGGGASYFPGSIAGSTLAGGLYV